MSDPNNPPKPELLELETGALLECEEDCAGRYVQTNMVDDAFLQADDVAKIVEWMAAALPWLKEAP
jgi:hypothetical protein